MKAKGCYAFPVSGESNAGRNWPTNSGRQRYHQALVGSALESSGNLSCLQDSRLDDCCACREHPTIRDRCWSIGRLNLPAYRSDLQSLCSRNVFQRRSDWRYASLCTAPNYWLRDGRSLWQPRSRRPSCSISVGFTAKQKIKHKCRAADQFQATFHQVQRCAPFIWGAP
jgi:hypothetical protein